jgi:hypothetical protein
MGGKYEKEDDPNGLLASAETLVGEQIHDHHEEDHEKHDHEEDDEQGPQHLTKTHDTPFVERTPPYSSTLFIDAAVHSRNGRKDQRQVLMKP